MTICIYNEESYKIYHLFILVISTLFAKFCYLKNQILGVSLRPKS